MTDEQVVEIMNNAWRALAKIYTSQPDNGTRQAMNILSRIIGEVTSEVKKSHQKEEKSNREGQVTIEEWIAFLEED